ncbi:MAG TPA: tetratricopeptide repeat protein [bacterium]
MSRRLLHVLVPGLALVAAVVVAYSPALDGGFIWDDADNIVTNENMTSPGGLARIWTDPRASIQYYPLTHTSFWLNYRASGLRPFSYHLVNVLLHAGSALLLWQSLAFLGVPGSWLAAAVFALHPANVESVAWITERKNTLSCFLMMISACLFLRAALEEEPAGSARRTRRYALSLLFFLAALLGKTAVALMPLGLAAILWWKKGAVGARDLLALAPFAALGGGFGLLTARLESGHLGASGQEFAWSVGERILIAGRSFWFYLWSLVWPADLVFIPTRWEITGSLPAWLFPMGAVAAAAGLWVLRGRIGRGPLAALGWFTAMVFPALGFFNVYFMRFAFVQQHFQYFASMGIVSLFAGASAALACRMQGTMGKTAGGARTVRAGAAALGAAVLMTLGGLTWRQSGLYANGETLWRDTLGRNPGAWIAHNNLAIILWQQGRNGEALEHFREYYRLHPDADAAHNLGRALRLTGRAEEAAGYLRIAVDLDPRRMESRIELSKALDQVQRPLRPRE